MTRVPWEEGAASVKTPGKERICPYHFCPLSSPPLYEMFFGISDFLEEISILSHSVVFFYFFALIAEEGFLISSCYSSPRYTPWKQTVTLCWEDAPGTSFPGSHPCGCTKPSTTARCCPPQSCWQTLFSTRRAKSWPPGEQRQGQRT